MNCSVCGKTSFIVNKKRQLCDECNFKRLHHGKSKQEVYQERAQGKEKKVYTIRPVSKKEGVNQYELRKAYLEHDKMFEPVCTGCGSGSKPLSRSHIIPRSRRKDLEADVNNFSFHCFGDPRCCHEKWESGSFAKMSSLDDFERRMLYIEQVDSEYYNLLQAKFEDQINRQ